MTEAYNDCSIVLLDPNENGKETDIPLPTFSTNHHDYEPQQMHHDIHTNHNLFNRSNTLHQAIQSTSSNLPKTKRISVQLSDVSQCTLNDSTINSLENDLLEPITSNENLNTNFSTMQAFEIRPNISSPLPDSINLLPDMNITNVDNVYDFLSAINIANYNGPNDGSDNSLFNSNVDIDYQFTLDPKILEKVQTSKTQSFSTSLSCKSDSTSKSNKNINIKSEPASPSLEKIASHDICIDHLKRSFTRLKQTSELINTEKVFICSLKILESVYLNNFMSDTLTPIYFKEFRQCVLKLLRNHEELYDNLVQVYNKWYNDSVNLVEPETDEKIKSISPNFEKYGYVSNEKEYLDRIIKLISVHSIDVETYSKYCSLYQRILNFTNLYEIEKYKRNTLIILNDYLVEHKDLQSDYLIDKRLDTRFISVVQMPTNRMVRYKLILQSLLKHIELDEIDKSKLVHYDESLIKIKLKIDSINSFVGNEELKLEKISNFKSFFTNNNNINNKMLSNDLFLENLEDLQISSSFGVVFNQSSKNRIYYKYLCAFLFKSHLILAKRSNINLNILEVKFVIPLMSIFDLESSFFSLSTNYAHSMNLMFEDMFNLYELSLIFPNEKEKLLWKGNLKMNLDKLNHNFDNKNNRNSSSKSRRIRFENNNNSRNSFCDPDFFYSDIQRRVLSFNLGDDLEKFNITSFIPNNIHPIRKINRNYTFDSDDIIHFDVDHFPSELNNNSSVSNNNSPRSVRRNNSIISVDSVSNFDASDMNSIKTKSSINLTSKSYLVKITLQERVSAQTCISSVWSKQFDLYTLNISISRSLSNMFHSKMSLSLLSLNTPTTPITSGPVSLTGTTNNYNNMNNNTSNPFIPPSPSFASNMSLGSPIKLRTSRSLRSFKDFNVKSPRTPASSAFNLDSTSHYRDFRSLKDSRDPRDQKTIYDTNNIEGNTVQSFKMVKSSSSLTVLSSIINNTVNSSAKSIVGVSSAEMERVDSTNSNSTRLSISPSTVKKRMGMSRFWKNLRYNGSKKK